MPNTTVITEKTGLKRQPRAAKPLPEQSRVPATVKKKAASRATRPVKPLYNAEDVHQMIATAAYYRAEQRAFSAGSAQEDWLLAEQEIRQRLAT